MSPSRSTQWVSRIDPAILVPALDREAATRGANELTGVPGLGVVDRRKDRLDDIADAHRVGVESGRRLLSCPLTGHRIPKSHYSSVDAIRVRGLNDPQDPSAGRIHSVRPMVVTDCLTAMIEFTRFDMNQVDRRYGSRPFPGERRGVQIPG